MPERAGMAIRGVLRVEPGKPSAEVDAVIEDGVLVAIGPGAAASAARAVDGRGLVLAPGFVDIHCHLREPGQPEKETIATAARAAAAGGFTTVVGMANTSPAVDDAERLRWVMERAADLPVRVRSVGALTRGLQGKVVADLEGMAEAGAVAFSDDGRNAYTLDLAVAAMERARKLDRAVLVHAQDEEGHRLGQLDPSVAESVGLAFWPCEAEVVAVERAIEAGRRTGARVHIQHVSCAGSVEALWAARRDGLPVTAEASPHHLALVSSLVLGKRNMYADPEAKVNPPLRPEHDRQAVVAALAGGVIDAVATDHAPHEAASKQRPFEQASFGFSGLETALGLCLSLVTQGSITMERLVECLTVGPWRCLQPGLDMPEPGLRAGEPADLCLFDPQAQWVVDPDRFYSRGHNTPLRGRPLRGKVLLTVASGLLVHAAEGVPVG
jgi:dihydroorotase